MKKLNFIIIFLLTVLQILNGEENSFNTSFSSPQDYMLIKENPSLLGNEKSKEFFLINKFSYVKDEFEFEEKDYMLSLRSDALGFIFSKQEGAKYYTLAVGDKIDNGIYLGGKIDW